MYFDKIVIASSNNGKIRELQHLLTPLDIQIIPQRELGVTDAEETGLTFVENAILKARNACEATGLPALADDSGLCIRALDNRPGIYSARYAGPGAKDPDLIAKVLEEMRDVPEDARYAEFHCVIAFLRQTNDPDPILAHGVWPGMITQKGLGEHGFGYDPIFYVPDQRRTAAELETEVKAKISHRARAIQQLMQFFLAI